MKAFGDYAEYYDLFYREKQYHSESLYVSGLIQKFFNGASSLLEFGCSTGSYTNCLADIGYNVVGIDLSPEMIAKACARAGQNADKGVTFRVGDVRTYRDESKYDAIVSLFHVINYQTHDSDLESAFSTVKALLVSGGVFVFDCWHGPGVLNDPPKNPVKFVKDGNLSATRKTTSMLIPEKNLVNVHFDFVLENKNGLRVEFSEDHAMRYLYESEVKALAFKNGFEFCAAYEWLSDKKPDNQTWYSCYVLRATA